MLTWLDRKFDYRDVANDWGQPLCHTMSTGPPPKLPR